MAEAWEAESFRDVYLPTRLHRISGRRLPALAWSAKGRFLNGQSRAELSQKIFRAGAVFLPHGLKVNCGPKPDLPGVPLPPVPIKAQ
jgi:hypothetical protein